MMILKVAPLPEDIKALGVEGVNRIWREAKLKAVGLKRAKALVYAAEHSIGNQEGSTAAKLEIRMLLEDYESRAKRLGEIMELIESLVKKIPMAEKMMKIKITEEMVKSLKAHVDSRVKMYSTYDPSQVDRASSALVFSEGRYAILIISDKQDAVKSAILEQIK